MAEVLTASFGLQAAPKWEKLRGNAYPDTETEQLTALEADETVRGYKKRREAWASDPYRPIYHMSSLYGMGDANGLCEWQGRYHLFYQFGPPGCQSGALGTLL